MPQRRIETTATVYFTFLREHQKDLELYSCFTDPEGTAFGGGGSQGDIRTVWGWRNIEGRFLEARTTYDVEWYTKLGIWEYNELNREDKFWLYLNDEGEDNEAQD